VAIHDVHILVSKTHYCIIILDSFKNITLCLYLLDNQIKIICFISNINFHVISLASCTSIEIVEQFQNEL